MPAALILGASGYAGLAVGQALLRSGNYTVYGTSRSAEKAKTLSTNEITPVIGDASDSAFLAAAIHDNHIDLVIDLTQAYENAGSILNTIVQAARKRAETLAKDKSVGPKLGFIYTSGTWVYGSPKYRVSDLTVPGTSLSPGTPATAVGWRPAHEQAVLAARDVLDVAVLRPSTIYGRASWVFGVWWGPLLAAAASSSTQEVHLSVEPEARMGLVHVDDLADAYVRAADRIDGRLGAWPVFGISGETLPVPHIIEGAAEALGVKSKIVYDGAGGNPFFEALSLVSNADTSRARTVLGWEASHRDFIANIGTTVAAWKASQQ